MADRSFETGIYKTSANKPIVDINGITRKLATEPLTRPDGSSLLIWHLPDHNVYDFNAGGGSILFLKEEVISAGKGSLERGVDSIGNILYKHAYYPEDGRVHDVLKRMFEMVKQFSES